MFLLINIFKQKIYSLRQKKGGENEGEEEGEEKKKIIRKNQNNLLSRCLEFVRGGGKKKGEKEGEEEKEGGVITCDVFEQIIFLLEGDNWEDEKEEKEKEEREKIGIEDRLLIYRKFIFCFPWRGLAMVLKGLCGVYEWGRGEGVGDGESGKERIETVKGFFFFFLIYFFFFFSVSFSLPPLFPFLSLTHFPLPPPPLPPPLSPPPLLLLPPLSPVFSKKVSTLTKGVL